MFTIDPEEGLDRLSRSACYRPRPQNVIDLGRENLYVIGHPLAQHFGPCVRPRQVIAYFPGDRSGRQVVTAAVSPWSSDSAKIYGKTFAALPRRRNR